MKNIHGSEKIKKGKIGRTVSTFHPAAGANTPVDGYIEKQDESTWSSARDASSGDLVTVTATVSRAFVRLRESPTRYSVARNYQLFDTSPIPDEDTIISATFSAYATTIVNNHTNSDRDVALVEVSPSNTNNLVAGDFDQIGSIEGASRKTLASMSTGAYQDWGMNLTGIGFIDKSGITKLGLRLSWDIDNVSPTPADASGAQFFFSSADETGTAQDPKLVVDHEEAPPTTSPGLFRRVLTA
jgi:hypothetical protein